MKDKRLILKLKQGDSKALNIIIEKYSSYVYTVIRNIIGDYMTEEDIEEVVSDSLVNLWNNSDKLSEDRPLTPYLSAIARNAATDGAVVNKIKEWTGNVTVYINGEEVEMPAKIKEIDGDEDCRIVEFEIDDENSDDNVNIEYYEYYDESDIPDDLEIEMEITTENSNENK